MKNQTKWNSYKKIINTVVKPALGCTEPIAAAYAASVAAEMLHSAPTRIHVEVSSNLFKNAMGVFVPGTGKIGLAIAAAAGAIYGNPEYGLEVLAGINQSDVDRAQNLIDAGSVTVKRNVETKEFIYCFIEMTDGNHVAKVELQGGHTQIVKKILDDVVVFEQPQNKLVSTGSVCDDVDISLAYIYEYATTEKFENIKFILDAADINIALSNHGLEHPYGLEIGRTLADAMNEGIITDDLMNDIIMRTSAASDARMGGATLPAMSNFGSGNQGIAATIPVVITANYYNQDQENLARALIISHLTAIYIKSFYPPLSGFCGNTVTSGAASMAMVYLAGGTFEQSCSALQNCISDVAGMICDGAKATCAMKVKSATCSACAAFLLAMHDQCASEQGIVAKNVEQSIRNIGRLVTNGISAVDTEIIDIMSA
ncbi:serine dehydratase subunit alpha family protein [Photobacterium carnosum]|uniref:UPF0597 protein CIK00_03470 n=1 Tax=Photobacterium carnosum TaxID=2023717 RepID=A0A2N4UWE0_9GAMM|nr:MULTISPECIES: L-serine ammonia-lyase, iron-sulfur-dependent, subunit alpha [Photobacterium]MCD9476299.1 serine dehydratase subunit alpha family protein [Photobacterium phosphoreum]MCD9488103.1 serine dehydratase subunit alpha family protein [Photobacterium iliopiscarium]MCD9508075.1 serine dehydratase subunit alpha family protein [Photobacterium phosphoreum]MCD9539186.1 serine dehydratase subunit alpha family protein [Photobacterium carnosum]MCD9542350.1 serine dehydratase subunit alpha fam